jgi:hypothetical protein
VWHARPGRESEDARDDIREDTPGTPAPHDDDPGAVPRPSAAKHEPAPPAEEARPDSAPRHPNHPAKPSLAARLKSAARAALAPPAGRRAELFCLAWIIPAWLVFELVATKLPHYTMPLYPPIALLTARGLLAAADGALRGLDSDTARLGHRVWLVVGVLLVAGGPIGVGFFGDLPVVFSGILVGLVAAAMLWRAWLRLGMGHVQIAQAWSVGAAAAALAGLLGVVMPAADGIWLSPQLARVIEAHDGPDRPIAAAGYHEDSLIFLTRGRIERIDDPAAWLREHTGGLLVAPPRDVTDLRLDLERLGGARGVNYSRGEFVDLAVYEDRR